jgi:hypothetical protein
MMRQFLNDHALNKKTQGSEGTALRNIGKIFSEAASELQGTAHDQAIEIARAGFGFASSFFGILTFRMPFS